MTLPPDPSPTKSLDSPMVGRSKILTVEAFETPQARLTGIRGQCWRCVWRVTHGPDEHRRSGECHRRVGKDDPTLRGGGLARGTPAYRIGLPPIHRKRGSHTSLRPPRARPRILDRSDR